MCKEQIDLCRSLFNWYSTDKFHRSVKTIRRCWLDIISLTPSRHDAVNTKFESQSIIKVKEVKAPSIILSKLESWFYDPSDVKAEPSDFNEIEID